MQAHIAVPIPCCNLVLQLEPTAPDFPIYAVGNVSCPQCGREYEVMHVLHLRPLKKVLTPDLALLDKLKRAKGDLLNG